MKKKQQIISAFLTFVTCFSLVMPNTLALENTETKNVEKITNVVQNVDSFSNDLVREEETNISTFIDGKSFNKTIKDLADGRVEFEENVAFHPHASEKELGYDYSIFDIIWSEEPFTSNVELQESGEKIYAKFDNGVIELYTKADTVYFNEDSSFMFYTLNNCKTISMLSSKINTSKTKNMSSMFETPFHQNVDDYASEHQMPKYQANSFLDLSRFDFSQIETKAGINKMLHGFHNYFPDNTYNIVYFGESNKTLKDGLSITLRNSDCGFYDLTTYRNENVFGTDAARLQSVKDTANIESYDGAGNAYPTYDGVGNASPTNVYFFRDNADFTIYYYDTDGTLLGSQLMDNYILYANDNKIGSVINDETIDAWTYEPNGTFYIPDNYRITDIGELTHFNIDLTNMKTKNNANIYALNYIENATLVSDLSVNLYAARNVRYTVTFETNGGSPIEPAKVKPNEKVTKPENPIKDFNYFDDWYKDKECTKRYYFDEPVTGDMTLYAKWKEYNYTVQVYQSIDNDNLNDFYNWWDTYDDPIGEIFSVVGRYSMTENSYKKVEDGVEIKDLDGYTKRIYYIDSLWDWNAKYIEYTPCDTFKEFMEKYPDCRFIVIYKTNHTVSFESNGGTPVDSQTVPKNEHVIKPVNPTKEGFTFEGWFKEESLATPWNFEKDVVTEDTILYASWKEITYTVSFESNGGTPVENVIVKYGDSLKTEDYKTTKENNIFINWYTDKALTKIWDGTVIGDMTVYAKWEENKYTVKFEVNGGSKIDDVIVKQGTSLNPNDYKTVKVEYVFENWYLDKDFKTVWNGAVPSNITVYAKWKKVEKTEEKTTTPSKQESNNTNENVNKENTVKQQTDTSVQIANTDELAKDMQIEKVQTSDNNNILLYIAFLFLCISSTFILIKKVNK